MTRVGVTNLAIGLAGVAIGLAVGFAAGYNLAARQLFVLSDAAQPTPAMVAVIPATVPPATQAADADEPQPRFIDRRDAVEDTQTGLIWQKDGSASGKLNYYQAKQYAADLLIGRPGWRLPTREELKTIFPATDAPFTNTRYNPVPYGPGNGKAPDDWNSYWTADMDGRREDYAFVYQWYAEGGANNCYASKNFVYVRCVHDPVKNVSKKK